MALLQQQLCSSGEVAPARSIAAAACVKACRLACDAGCALRVPEAGLDAAHDGSVLGASARLEGPSQATDLYRISQRGACSSATIFSKLDIALTCLTDQLAPAHNQRGQAAVLLQPLMLQHPAVAHLCHARPRRQCQRLPCQQPPACP